MIQVRAVGTDSSVSTARVSGNHDQNMPDFVPYVWGESAPTWARLAVLKNQVPVQGE